MLFVCLYVCLSVCHQNYCKTSQPTPLKLDVVMGPTNRKNRLTFAGARVPDPGSRSLFHKFHLHQQYRIGHFKRLLAFLIQLSAAFHETWLND